MHLKPSPNKKKYFKQSRHIQSEKKNKPKPKTPPYHNPYKKKLPSCIYYYYYYHPKMERKKNQLCVLCE